MEWLIEFKKSTTNSLSARYNNNKGKVKWLPVIFFR